MLSQSLTIAMKKVLVFFGIILFSIVSLRASVSKFDAYTRMQFSRAASRSGADVKAFVRVGSAAFDPESYGLRLINSWPGGLLLLSGSQECFMSLADCDDVTGVCVERPVKMVNNSASAHAGVPAILSGEGLDGRSFSGKGVVTGLFDAGFDVQNPSFCHADGSSRVERIFHYTQNNGTPSVYSVPSMIEAFITDSDSDTHGSHVLGTMAGSYSGAVDYAVLTTDGIIGSAHADKSPFDGMAPEASIAIACGALTDANIADGVKRISDYARSVGKPCVINLSLADILGPHDGSEAFAAALSAVARDAIIVVSAGNYAGQGVSLSRTFGPREDALRTFLRPVAWKRDASGSVEVWSSTATPLDLSIVVYDTGAAKKELARVKAPADPDGDVLLIATTDCSKLQGFAPSIHLGDFDKAYTDSYIAVVPTRSPSGRHGYHIDFDIDINPENKGAYFAAGIEVKGLPGQGADLYIDSQYCQLRGLWVSGWSEGGDDMSVSSMACARGVLCVGAYTTSAQWPVLGGTIDRVENFEEYVENDIAPFSSYGTLRDGRTLPHVAAPGAALVSVFSTPYVEANPGNAIVATGYAGGRGNYWRAQYGTSMSAPVVSGAVALWLQADPTLTADDVYSIIEATSVRDDMVSAAPVRWGAGRFDAYAGIKEVLRRASVAGPSVDSGNDMLLRCCGGQIEVTMPGGAFEAVLYDLSGREVCRSRATDCTAVVTAPSPGVYVVRAGACCRKVVVGRQ